MTCLHTHVFILVLFILFALIEGNGLSIHLNYEHVMGTNSFHFHQMLLIYLSLCFVYVAFSYLRFSYMAFAS